MSMDLGDYTKILFIEKKKHSSKAIATYRVNNRNEHIQLSKNVAARGNFLWYRTDETTTPSSQEKIETESLESLTCPFCSKQFTTPSGRTLHMKTCKQEETTDLSCPYCSFVAKSTSGRTLHIKSNHGNET